MNKDKKQKQQGLLLEQWAARGRVEVNIFKAGKGDLNIE